MVDIDEELVSICRQHLSSWSNGAYEDPRLELVIADGRKFLEQTEETFDVIIMDLNDPTEESPAIYLFTREFYQLLHHRLSRDGVASFQGADLQPNRLTLHARMFNTISSQFKWVAAYPYMMPSFHETHSFILASKELEMQRVDLGAKLQKQEFDLHYLSPAFCKKLFNVPAYVEEAYKTHQELITDAKPSLYDT
jgi:spermidine synthase